MRNSYDVIVLGLGGVGSAAIADLSARGHLVLGLEQYGPAHDRGSSHGLSRMIRRAYFEDPCYVPLVLGAYEGWLRLEAESGGSLLTETGGLMIGPPSSRAVSGSRRSAECWDLRYEVLSPADVRGSWPHIRLGDDEIAIYDARAGFVRPEAAVKAQLDLATRRGAVLRFGERVTGWKPARNGVTVSTATGRFTAARLIITPGAWAGQLLAGLGLPLTVERHVQYWFAPADGAESLRGYPVYIWEPSAAPSFYGFPAESSLSAEVKAAFFRQGVPADPDALDREVPAGAENPLRLALATRVPALDVPCVRSAPCMYTVTPDEHFVVGTHPGLEQVVIGAGFSGHGFKFVPVLGQILADLAIDGRTGYDVSLFGPERFGQLQVS